MKTHYIIPIFIPHIGCPNMCVFCNQNKITGQLKRVTREDILKTVDEHLSTIKSQGPIELAFFGGSFTGIDINYQIELLKVGKELIDCGKIDYMRVSTRPDYINEEILKNLKEYGVKIIELGVQSMDDEVLKASKRGHTSEDVIKASLLIKSFGFILGHQMMLGLPKDCYEKCINTAKELIKLKPDIMRIYPVLVIKDTELESMYKSGEYESLKLEDALNWCKDVLILLEDKNIKVIRIGLQTTDSICEDGDVVAGPFHASFRELVESKIFLDMIIYCLDKINLKSDESVSIYVNKCDISRAIGNKKTNIIALKNKYNLKNINILLSEECEKDCIMVKTVKQEINLSKTFFVNSIAK
jgi:histone acetyltransferase (RNA polymerase elongator complex component)